MPHFQRGFKSANTHPPPQSRSTQLIPLLPHANFPFDSRGFEFTFLLLCSESSLRSSTTASHLIDSIFNHPVSCCYFVAEFRLGLARVVKCGLCIVFTSSSYSGLEKYLPLVLSALTLIFESILFQGSW